MANVIQFKKAVKKDARGRVALIGPAGSGKSYTMLKLARLLAGPDGRIAAIDTEHGSLSKYADIEEFDVFELDSFSPENFMAALDAAEKNEYTVFCVDSLSHFWVGKDGALEFVDVASRKHRDNMGGWKDFRPHERAMVDRMIASPCHVIVTMRTKTEYVEEVNPQTGKKGRRKVGLAPVQRESMEYEFDMVGYMDDENTLIIDKTRCSAYSGKAIVKPSGKDFEPLNEWLKGVKVEAVAKPAVEPTRIDQGQKPWHTRAEMEACFYQIEEKLTQWDLAPAYANTLKEYGVSGPKEFKKPEDALSCYRNLEEVLRNAESRVA